MRFARFVLLAQALVMACLSLAYWLRPHEMANLNGMLLMETASVSHMRVYYGGLQLGLALFLIWSARAPERARPALIMLVMTMAALVLGRLVSLWVDGGELVGFDLASMLYRVLAVVLAGGGALGPADPRPLGFLCEQLPGLSLKGRYGRGSRFGLRASRLRPFPRRRAAAGHGTEASGRRRAAERCRDERGHGRLASGGRRPASEDSAQASHQNRPR